MFSSTLRWIITASCGSGSDGNAATTRILSPEISINSCDSGMRGPDRQEHAFAQFVQRNEPIAARITRVRARGFGVPDVVVNIHAIDDVVVSRL